MDQAPKNAPKTENLNGNNPALASQAGGHNDWMSYIRSFSKYLLGRTFGLNKMAFNNSSLLIPAKHMINT